MADRITINFAANTREVEQGADRIDDSLTNVEKALEDVGTEGERSLEKTTDAASDLEKGTRDVEGSVRELGSAATDALGGDLVGGAESALTSILGLGAIGGAGGIVATSLIEIARGFGASWEEESEATKERISSMYDDMLESGANFLSDNLVQQNVTAIVQDAEKLKTLNDYAIDTGIAVADLIAAEAGAGGTRSALLEKINGQLADNVALQEAGGFETQAEADALDAQIVKLDRVREHFDGLASEQRESLNLVQTTRDVLDVIESGSSATVFARKEENEQIQKRNKLLADTPTTVTSRLVLDTNEADKQLASLFAKPRYVKTNAVDRNGKPII